MPLGETYDRNLRVTSLYSRSIFAELENISNHIDFRHPRFMFRAKRNRSLGSVQAFIVELALTDDAFMARLRQFMIDGGRGYTRYVNYTDRYF